MPLMSAMKTPVGSRRLTQSERSAATRQALLDSTIECVVELGYENATTTEISERAGLSRGAHLHHFQTRATLIAAAVDDLVRRVAQEMADEVERLPDGQERQGAALDMLWRVFNGPLFMAVLELSMHARADPELRAQLEPVEDIVGHVAMPSLRRAFAGDADDHRLDYLIIMFTSTVRGLALLPLLEPHPPVERAWEYSRSKLLALLTEEVGG
jgi:AcrR family transcriptional regulator